MDRSDPVEQGLRMYNEKRMMDDYGIPYTNICCNSIASWPYQDNCHPTELPPPIDQFQIYGDGSVTGTYNQLHGIERIVLLSLIMF